MQDRFRFRVWNKKNKEMIYNAEIAYDGMNYNTSWRIGKNTNDGWVDCFGYYLDYPEDYEVMQCTGLKDKNGKLIFEGDIVKDDNDALHYVKWVYDSWQLFPCTQNNYTIGIVDDEIEVIGNIYENPELLED